MPAKISVIIPAFNRAKLLRRALDSVFAQTEKPHQVCVVDDGSSDNTAEIVQQHYPEVIYIYQPNQGVSSARNKGVQATTGEWVAFLDNDDEWLPDKLAQQSALLRQNPEAKLVHCEENWIRNGIRVNQKTKHRKSGGDIFERCLALCVVSPSAVLIARDLLQDLGGFDETLPACEDYDLWLKVCCQFPVFFVTKPLVNKYGGHKDQLSRKYWGMDRFRVVALENLLASGRLNSDQEEAVRAKLLEKCEILRLGADKRGNQQALTVYTAKLEKYAGRDNLAQQ